MRQILSLFACLFALWLSAGAAARPLARDEQVLILPTTARWQGGAIEARIDLFAERERQLIEMEDTQFRFHSGPPAPGASYPEAADA